MSDILNPQWNWIPMQEKICELMEQHAFIAGFALQKERAEYECTMAVLALAVKSTMVLYGKDVESVEQAAELFAGILSDIMEMPNENCSE